MGLDAPVERRQRRQRRLDRKERRRQRCGVERGVEGSVVAELDGVVGRLGDRIPIEGDLACFVSSVVAGRQQRRRLQRRRRRGERPGGRPTTVAIGSERTHAPVVRLRCVQHAPRHRVTRLQRIADNAQMDLTALRQVVGLVRDPDPVLRRRGLDIPEERRCEVHVDGCAVGGDALGWGCRSAVGGEAPGLGPGAVSGSAVGLDAPVVARRGGQRRDDVEEGQRQGLIVDERVEGSVVAELQRVGVSTDDRVPVERQDASSVGAVVPRS